MLVVSRFRPGPDVTEQTFSDRLAAALQAFAARPGYVRGRAGRSTDDPGLWVLSTEWESVGAYRRSLSGFDVKRHATPLVAEALDEPSAFELLVALDAGQDAPTRAESLRAGP